VIDDDQSATPGHTQPPQDHGALTLTVTGFCEVHGEFEQRAIPGLFGGAPIRLGGCPQCQPPCEDSHDPAAEDRRQATERLVARSRIPAEYLRVTLDSFPQPRPEQRRIVSSCRTWLSRFPEMVAGAKRGSWLVLLGPVGSGKTGLACSLMHALMSQGYGCQYHTLTSVRRWCWDARHRGSNETEAIEHLSRIDVLVIDEIGASTASDAESALFGELIANRCAARKPTILVSNLSREQLCERLDPRVVDRILQRAAWFSCDWPSLRTGRAVNADGIRVVK
jgi:DNA replication protein DnaC